MITRAKFMGGAQDLTPGADFFLVPEAGKFARVTQSVASVKAKLPPATGYPQKGGSIAFVFNNHATNTLTLADNGGNVIASLTPGQMAIVLLYGNTTANGLWSVIIRNKKT
jgi:hypothetical protein